MSVHIKKYRGGIDIGSTTVKLVLIDEDDNIVFGKYRRHQARTQETLAEHRMYPAIRMSAESRRRQRRYKGTEESVSAVEHSCGRLRSRSKRGQSAQPHQAHAGFGERKCVTNRFFP